MSLPSYETLKVSMPFPDVLHIELDRPKKLNAMSKQMWKDIGAAFTSASSSIPCRVIVLSGLGRGFSAGLDLADFTDAFSAGSDPARNAFAFMDLVEGLQSNISAVEKCRVPVIAAVHGPCVGGAIDLITACDIRYTASDSIFSVREVDIGLAADVGTLQRLPKVVGNQSWVHEICFTGRNFLPEESLAQGLVSQVTPGSREQVLQAAFQTARLIAEKSPVAVAGTKNVLKYSRDHSVEDGLRYVGVWNSAMTQTEDMAKAASAAFSKKKAVFAKL